MVRLPENRVDDMDGSTVPSLAALSQEVKELVRLISSTDISELHLESGPVRITIKRGVGQQHAGTGNYVSPVYTPPATLPEAAPSSVLNLIGSSHAHGGDLALAEGEEVLVAPMVGTFYAAPTPGEDPYISEGDIVEPGYTVGIIEAMKMMNEIEAETAGRVTRILVENAQPVEYGQPLMVIQTA
jgi:acetyl-CoA carboxylase biotin carboxyl carrier protein